MVVARRPDVVLAYCTGLAALASHPSLDGVPLVLDMVDVDSAKWRDLAVKTAAPLRWVYAREARCLARFEADIVARARATTVVSERERTTLKSRCPGANVQVVSNGIDVAHFGPPGPPAQDARVVFCGVLDYPPNEQAAVRLCRDIWPLVRWAAPEAGLLLLGSNPTARIHALAARDRSIEVTGAVPDVRPHLWRSAVSVAPIEVARGLQNKVLEALAAGLPAVVTPVVAQGLPDGVMPACLVAGPDGDFAEAILSLLRQRPAARRAVAAQADCAPLRWDATLAPLLPLLDPAAAPRPAAPFGLSAAHAIG